MRSFGSSLLAALEKGDAEQLALLRQTNEVNVQQMLQNVRYLEWKHAQETTNSLLKTRASAVERYTYYLRLLNLTPDPGTVPAVLTSDERELTEDNWDDTYSALVGEYDIDVARSGTTRSNGLPGRPPPRPQPAATGQGQLYLNQNEDTELNTNLPIARDARLTANVANSISSGLFPIPSAELHLAFWGMGLHSNLVSGQVLGAIAKLAGDIANVTATWNQDQAGMAARTAGHQRRVDEWTLQGNLAAHELMQIGNQVLASLIAEQVAYHNYTTVKTQVRQAAGHPELPAEQVHERRLLHVDAERDLRPVLPVLPTCDLTPRAKRSRR